MITPEFSRTVGIDRLGPAPQNMAIVAEPGEREALARRFGLVALESLTAELELCRRGSDVRLNGRVRGRAVQACVATGAPVKAEIDEPMELVFRPANAGTAEEEIELSASELDVIEYDGGTIDVGEAAAETLCLALDPYPRTPGTEQPTSTDDGLAPGPFAVLGALKRDGKKPPRSKT